MIWNYRLVKTSYGVTHGEETEFVTIHEVYYDEDGEPTAWCPEASAPRGDTQQELADDMKHMLEAFDRPFFVVPAEWL